MTLWALLGEKGLETETVPVSGTGPSGGAAVLPAESAGSREAEARDTPRRAFSASRRALPTAPAVRSTDAP